MSGRGSLRAALVACVPAVLVVAAVPFAARAVGAHVSLFTRDVFSIGGIPVYAGLTSNLGVFLWCATAAVCFFAGVSVRRSDPGASAFLLAGGALTAFLMIDDFFMIHEWILPVALDIPEDILPMTYGAVGILWLFAFRRRVAAGEPWLLALAILLLGVSEVLDLLEPEHPPGVAPAWRYLAEEGPKLVGIAAWAAWLMRDSARAIRGLRWPEPGP